ncbi:uncharacterized protein RJT21DRAFT_138608 [Scheffersomyces amazonensis]|uniref:uncharacterized protein n=1 Tax=Scheffersomyces amazonensis TaxID=1078765 RepID=UPI00315D8F35
MSSGVIDDEEDPWSYSFPASNDSLPINSSNEVNKEETERNTSSTNSSNNSNKLNNRLSVESNGSNLYLGVINNDKKIDSTMDSESQLSSNSSLEKASMELRHRKLHIVTPTSKASRSSLSLQSPFIQKSTPADPKTTKHDANSIISKDSSGNGLFQESIRPEEYLSPTKSGFLGNLQGLSNLPSDSTVNEPKDNLISSPKSINDIGSPRDSPKIIAYRKSRRTISEGNYLPSIDTPDNVPIEKFDSRLYVDEFFADSNYRYAALKRNIDFHQLFRSIDLTDRLLEDFACALSREILLQGRIYISENYICFNSNLLGWVTSLIIPMNDIIGFEKKHTAGLFPNGIAIETNEIKHTFASFLSRDMTFDFIVKVWEESTGRKLESSETASSKNEKIDNQNNDNIINSSNIPNLDINDQKCLPEESPRIHNYIMSIDENEAEEYSEDEDSQDEDSQEEFTEYISSPIVGTSENGGYIDQHKITSKILKFKPDSKYKNLGPDTHSPTQVGDSFTPEDNEIELCEEIIDAPLGIIFDITFGETNTSFHRNFIETHDGSELSEYSIFQPSEDDPTKSERSYTYRRALGYSIGPKSTKCEVTEVIEHLNFADYINIVTTTSTPDVPSGNSFTVKTRYLFTWAEDNKTKLNMSFFIKWTGTSWIKGVIEKQSLAGQKAVIKDYIDGLKKEINQCTILTEGIITPPIPINEEIRPIISTPKVKKVKISKENVNVSSGGSVGFIKNNLIYVLYLILSFFVLLLIIQLRLFKVVNESNELIKSQVLINTHLLYAIQAITPSQADEIIYKSNDEDQLWKWVDKTYGKKLSPVEKVKFLTYQLQNIYQDEESDITNKHKNNKKITFNDIKKSVKNFNYQDYLNVDDIKEKLL